MKSALFSGVAAVFLLAGQTAMAADAAVPATVPATVHGITFADVKVAADTMWNRLDANHDGKIDAADHDARLLERFAEWDTNHDGEISKDEFLVFAHAREAHWRGHGPDAADGPPPPPAPGGEDWHKGGEGRRGPGGPGPHGGGFLARAVIAPALHDARKDGVVIRAAFDAAVKARFDALDANHDGTLTRDELPHNARGASWRGAGDHGPRRGGGFPPPGDGE